MDARAFRRIIYAHFRKEGRVFPWRNLPAGRQGHPAPYRIFVSEVMLQQTQAPRVEGKYREFLAAFPGWRSLARAPIPKLLRTWQGLGYNRRALNLKRAAKLVMKKHGGRLPRRYEDLIALPGVGPYTARAVAAFAWNEPAPFIETNIRTAYIHFFFPKRKKVSDKELLPLVEATMDRENPRQWYHALMDYGVFLKRTKNAARRSAHYAKQSPFKGSHRELRGRILKLLLEKKKISARAMPKLLQESKERVGRALAELAREGFIKSKKGKWFLSAYR